ncbi:MAG: hypothetical protein PHX18_05925 [Candidatus Gastranaerophilales bacterium]|nr:hypothetical protein [Candidatus Gastranaerophilales bacterium]
MAEGTGLNNLNRPIINMNNAEVANNPNDKNSSEEYFDRRNRGQQDENRDFNNSNFVDRSAQLRATLNSLASLNKVNIIKTKDKYKNNGKKENTSKNSKEKIVQPIEEE